MITELGHDNTKKDTPTRHYMDRINRRTIRKRMGYGWVYFGYEVNNRTINYIIKYITKKDESNPEFNGKIFTSKKSE